jgi:hypothetical protein
VFASLLLTGALLIMVGGLTLLVVAYRLRRKVRRVGWLLTRATAAIGEAERAGRVRAELADTP